jgi:hypothetical protein
MVVVSAPFATVTGALWLSGLHLVLAEKTQENGRRFQLCDDGLSACAFEQQGTGDETLLEVAGKYARLWVTEVTMQQVLVLFLSCPNPLLGGLFRRFIASAYACL